MVLEGNGFFHLGRHLQSEDEKALVLAHLPVERGLAKARKPPRALLVEVQQKLVGETPPALAGEDEPVEPRPEHLVAQRKQHIHRSTPLDLKLRCRSARPVGFFQDVLTGTANAPWLWWAVALVVIVVLLVLGLRLLGVFPD